MSLQPYHTETINIVNIKQVCTFTNIDLITYESLIDMAYLNPIDLHTVKKHGLCDSCSCLWIECLFYKDWMEMTKYCC